MKDVEYLERVQQSYKIAGLLTRSSQLELWFIRFSDAVLDLVMSHMVQFISWVAGVLSRESWIELSCNLYINVGVSNFIGMWACEQFSV